MPEESSNTDAAAAASNEADATSLNLPSLRPTSRRPPNVTHLSTPAYESPLRHHRRQPSVPHQVKETLHARSEYTNKDGDGAAIHRINQYVIKQEIGRGSFGAVHLAVDHQGVEYAVKEFSKSKLRKRAQSNMLRRPHGPKRQGAMGSDLNIAEPLHQRSASRIYENEGGGNALNLIQQEIAIMKKLNHSNLVCLYEVLDDPAEDSLYMVLEMCKKGVVMKVGMNEMADPYPPEDCRCWFRDLLLGIEYLHAQGVCHRDIKPDNLLLSHDNVLKIVDFGVSEMFEKHSDMTTAKSAGSPAFLPPELCVSRHGGISGKAADVWSMGVTLYCLYFGRVPFDKTGVLELYESIKREEPDYGSAHAEEDFHDLIKRLLEKDPCRRITIPEIRDHPWVTRRNTDPLLPAEENTSDLVADPTEEEVEKAITSNMSKLLVTMKAVHKFKSLLGRHKSSSSVDNFGSELTTVQSPFSMEPQDNLRSQTSKHSPDHGRAQDHPRSLDDSSSRPGSAALALHQKAFSEDTHDRKPVEQALARDGVHHRIDADIMAPHPVDRSDASLLARHTVENPTDVGSMDGEGGSPIRGGSRANSGPPAAGPRDISAHPEEHRGRPTNDHGSSPQASHHLSPGKGHAHDPLDDFLFLAVGAGDDHRRESIIRSRDTESDSAPAKPDAAGHALADEQSKSDRAEGASEPLPREPLIVSESPPAADEDIFSAAYHKEVNRIRSRTDNPMLYLTRRMESPDEHADEQDGHGTGASKGGGLANMIHRATNQKDRGSTLAVNGGSAPALAKLTKRLAISKHEVSDDSEEPSGSQEHG